MAVEEPLAIEIAYEEAGENVEKRLAVIRRTPGNDEELAMGFLFGEGLIAERAEVIGGSLKHSAALDIWQMHLARPPSNGQGLPASIHGASRDELTRISAGALAGLPTALGRLRAMYQLTGGTHVAVLCDTHGTPLLAREDVRTLNAIDKVLGAAPLRDLARVGRILGLSSSVDFEAVGRASIAGITAVVSLGAPTTTAVSRAQDLGLTLVGFATEEHFQVYAHAERIG